MVFKCGRERRESECQRMPIIWREEQSREHCWFEEGRAQAKEQAAADPLEKAGKQFLS